MVGMAGWVKMGRALKKSKREKTLKNLNFRSKNGSFHFLTKLKKMKKKIKWKRSMFWCLLNFMKIYPRPLTKRKSKIVEYINLEDVEVYVLEVSAVICVFSKKFFIFLFSTKTCSFPHVKYSPKTITFPIKIEHINRINPIKNSITSQTIKEKRTNSKPSQKTNDIPYS